MAIEKIYASPELQTNVRISGDGVDTTNGGTSGSDKVITSGAFNSGLDTVANINGDNNENFTTNDLTVTGDITIQGTINQETVTNLAVVDKTITLNNGGTLGANQSGLVVDGSGTTTDAGLYYDGSTDKWQMAVAGNGSSPAPNDISTFDGAYGSLTGVPTTMTPAAHNHAASEITSGTFGDARVAQSNVTQHEAALSIGYSQLTSVPTTFTPAAHNHAASDINSGSFADARIASSNVTQHEAALGIDWSQLASVPSSFVAAAHNHSASEITSGAFANARIASSNVTQHQAAISVGASQINAGSMANARIAQSNITQHENALQVDWSQLTGAQDNDRCYSYAFTTMDTMQISLPTATEVSNAMVQIYDSTGAQIRAQIVKNTDDLEITLDRTATGTVQILTQIIDAQVINASVTNPA